MSVRICSLPLLLMILFLILILILILIGVQRTTDLLQNLLYPKPEMNRKRTSRSSTLARLLFSTAMLASLCFCTAATGSRKRPRDPVTVFKTVALGDVFSLVTVTEEREKKHGMKHTCELQLFSGSSLFEEFLVVRQKENPAIKDTLDILELANRVATHPYREDESFFQIKHRKAVELFSTWDEYKLKKSAASSLEIEFFLADVPFRTMVKALHMGNVYYRDRTYAVADLQELSDLVHAFGLFGFRRDARVGVQIGGDRDEDPELVWIPKHAMFAINLGKVLAGNERMSTYFREAAAGTDMDAFRSQHPQLCSEVERDLSGPEAASRVKDMLRELRHIPEQLELLRTVQIQLLEAFETSNPKDIPVTLDRYNDKELVLAVIAEQERVHGYGKRFAPVYLRAALKAGTFKPLEVRIPISTVPSSQAFFWDNLAKTLEMFTHIGRIHLYLSPSLDLHTYALPTRETTDFAGRVLDVVLAHMEKNAGRGIEGLALGQYNMLTDARVSAIESLSPRTLGFTSRLSDDHRHRIAQLLSKPGILSSTTTLFLTYFTLFEQHRLIGQMENLRTVELVRYVGQEGELALHETSFRNAVPKHIETLILSDIFSFSLLMFDPDSLGVQRVFQVLRPQHLIILKSSVSHSFLSALAQLNLPNLGSLKTATIHFALREMSTGTETVALANLFQLCSEHTDVTITAKNFPTRLVEGKHRLTPEAELICLATITYVRQLPKAKRDRINLSINLFHPAKKIEIPDDSILRQFSRITDTMSEAEQTAFLEEINRFITTNNYPTPRS